MITQLSKVSSTTLDQVANFILENRRYLSETFPKCRNKGEVANALGKSAQRWTVLITDRPLAIFTVTQRDSDAMVDHFCPENMNSLDSIFATLREDLGKRKLDRLMINVPVEETDAFIKTGLEKKSTLVGLFGRVAETKVMPMLPLSHPRQEDVLALGKLMYDSYAKSAGLDISSEASAQNLVRNTIDGLHGTFLQDASFVSNASGKFVSASLVTSDDSESATIAYLFTHPLYRARGLATTEITMGMNRLMKQGISNLNVWVVEVDLVARRLFGKLGFSEDRKLTQMQMRIR